jgi:diguanylate cyclase (GGDEF)-like protein
MFKAASPGGPIVAGLAGEADRPARNPVRIDDHAPPAALERRKGRFRLLRYFSIASLLAIIVALAALGVSFRQAVLQQLLHVTEENNISLSRLFSDTLRPDIVALIAATGKSNAPRAGENVARTALHEAVSSAVRQTSVVKLQIYDLQGHAIYSSDARDTGGNKSLDPAFIEARAGGAKTVSHPEHSIDAFGRPLANRDLLSSFVPVRRAGAANPDAVLELYTDVTPFLQDIQRMQRDMRLAVGTVLILLYGALFFIVKRADDVIRSQATQSEQDEKTILHLAHHDALTGLPNRRLFSDRLAVTLTRAKRTGGMAALMFIDLDRFKEINDTLGHAVGDRVLQAVATRLRGLLREADTVARYGGDEFTIILEDVPDAEHVGTVALKISEALSTPVVTENGRDIVVTPSTGIALFPADADRVDALMKAADSAMYDAKAAGRNVYRFYCNR